MLDFKVTNPRGDVWALKTGNTINNVPTQSSSISVRPRGLSVTFDPNVCYQTVPSDNPNTSYWSMNAAASNRTSNATRPHFLPNESVVTGTHSQYTNVGCTWGSNWIFSSEFAHTYPPYGHSEYEHRPTKSSSGTRGSIRIFSPKPARAYPSYGHSEYEHRPTKSSPGTRGSIRTFPPKPARAFPRLDIQNMNIDPRSPA